MEGVRGAAPFSSIVTYLKQRGTWLVHNAASGTERPQLHLSGRGSVFGSQNLVYLHASTPWRLNTFMLHTDCP